MSNMSSEPTSSCGLRWSKNEIRCLIDIWSDDSLRAQLSSCHRNSKVYAVFAERMMEKGFSRSVQQCRVKTKKLRWNYIRVCKALKRAGGYCPEKERFVWFDKLHEILGRVVDDPVAVVESHESQLTPEGTADQTLSPSGSMSPLSEDISGLGVESSNSSSNIESTNTGTDEGVSECFPGPSTTENKPNATLNVIKFPIHGTRTRKRRVRAKSRSAVDDFGEYMVACKKMMEYMMDAEQRHMAQEEAAFERLLQAQKEDSERRFRAMLEQQQATNQMIMHLITALTRQVNPLQQPSSTTPTANMASTSAPNSSSLPQQKQDVGKDSNVSLNEFKDEFELFDELNPEAFTHCPSPGGTLRTDTVDHSVEAEKELIIKRILEEETKQSVSSQPEDSSTNAHISIKEEPEDADRSCGY